MFLLGQWKSFDELEEYLTLDELIEVFNATIERENRQMEFHASLAGAEIRGSETTDKQADEAEPTNLTERIKARQQKDREEKSKTGKSEFAHGVGYTVIGG